MASSAPSRTKVFISYSHKDAKYLEGLLPHLRYLEESNLIDLWADTKIHPGERWQDEVAAALASTKVAILLISIDFLVSPFIRDNELPPLLAAAETEGVKVVPVILRPCTLPKSLTQFQSVNNPAKPLVKMKGYEREELWVKVANATIDETPSQTPKTAPFNKQQTQLPEEIMVTKQPEKEELSIKRYWDDFANTEREIRSFIKEYGASDIMPTGEVLRENGREDLQSAITTHGGYEIVAKRLGLQLSSYKEKNSESEDFLKEVTSKMADNSSEILKVKGSFYERTKTAPNLTSNVTNPIHVPKPSYSYANHFKRAYIIPSVIMILVLLSFGVFLEILGIIKIPYPIAPATVAANPDPYPPTYGKLAYYDTMGTNSLNSLGMFVTTGCSFRSDGFHVFNPGNNTSLTVASCISNRTDLENFAFEVQVTIIAGNCSDINFREELSNYYTAEFCQNGTYQLSATTADAYNNTSSQTLAGGSSSAILKGLKKSNVVAIVANGDAILLYINHQKVTSVVDGTVSHGSIAFVGSADNGPCEVVYNNAKVWTL